MYLSFNDYSLASLCLYAFISLFGVVIELSQLVILSHTKNASLCRHVYVLLKEAQFESVTRPTGCNRSIVWFMYVHDCVPSVCQLSKSFVLWGTADLSSGSYMDMTVCHQSANCQCRCLCCGKPQTTQSSQKYHLNAWST